MFEKHWPTEFKPVEDKKFYDWVGKGCHGPLNAVARYMPQKFEQYVHICHPAWTFPANVNLPSFTGATQLERAKQMIPTTWSAALAKKCPNFSGLQKWHQVGFNLDYNNLSSGDIHSPLEGTPPLEAINAIESAISRVTEPEENCIFAVWDGFSNFCQGHEHLKMIKISAMGQRYHWILQAPRQVLFNYWRSRLKSPYFWELTQIPQAVWSIKQLWFYAVPFHTHSSLFGGSSDMTKILLAASEVEAYELPKDHLFKG